MTTPYASEAFLHQLLAKALAANASDVHLRVGQPPGARVRGDMVYFRVEKIRPDDTEAVAQLLLGARAGRDPLEGRHEGVTSYQAAGVGRFRVSLYRQRGTLSLVLRSIPLKVPTFEELGVPAAAAAMADHPRGLVIVAGGAGQGKSTTLAAMIGHINTGFAKHVITIEDPIEFVHEDNRASVSQREVGADTESYAVGLRTAVRQDPDVVMAAEIDRLETLSAALDVAETGRLVFAATPTLDVQRTVARLFALTEAQSDRDRVIDNLQGILAQRLLLKRDGSGLVLASEILVATPAVRDALRRATATAAIKELMEKGTNGMQTFEGTIKQMIAQNQVSRSSLPG